MTRRTRSGLFGVAATGVAALLAWGFAGLPSVGSFAGDVSALISRITVPERHATNLVSATTFDFRGLDTLGEEFILFAASVGVLALLRLARSDERVAADPEEAQPTAASATVARICGAFAGPVCVLGLYVILHGHLTPGGGFQGGVILAAALLLAYLAGSTLRSGRLAPVGVMELAKGLGAAGFVVLGLAGLAFGAAFLDDLLPLGTTGNLISAGTYPLLNLAVGLEVAGAMLLILGELLDQRLLAREGSSS